MSDPAQPPHPPAGLPAEPSMVTRFFKDGAVYVVAGMASQGIMFLLFPFLAHIFNPRDYGIIDLLGLFGTLALMIVALEIAQGLAPYYAERSTQERRLYASTALLFSIAAFTVFAAIVLAFAEPLTHLLLGADVAPRLLRMQVAVTWVSGVFYLAQDLFRWQLRPRPFAITSVAAAAVTTASGAVLILALDFGVEGALLGQLLGSVVGLLLVAMQSRGTFALHFDVARCRQMLAFSLPLVPSSIGVFLNGYADRLAIQADRSLADVGIYGVAFRLSLISWLALIGFQGALLPLVLSRHELPQTPAEVGRIFRLFCALALATTLLMSTFADELLRVLTQPAYYDAAPLVPFLVAAAFLTGMWIFAPGMTIHKRSRPIAAASVLAGLLNLGLAFALVPPLGTYGAGVATLCSSVIGFAILMWLSQRLWHVPHQWRLIGIASTLVAALTAASTALPSATDELPALGAKLIIAAAGMGTLWALLIDRDERTFARDYLRRLRAARSH